MPTVPKKDQERHSTALSLFFHYKYLVICALLLAILGVVIPPRSTTFTPLVSEVTSDGENQLSLSATQTPRAVLTLVDSVYNGQRRTSKKESEQRLALFNPDTLSRENWQQIGFSAKQAEVILKYRNKIGGFRYKEQLADCFVINASAYKWLEPYIALPNKPKRDTLQAKDANTKELFYFNPDTASIVTFQALGFSEKQARVLVHFREVLGGRFASPEQFGKSFVVDSATLERLRPYMVFE